MIETYEVENVEQASKELTRKAKLYLTGLKENYGTFVVPSITVLENETINNEEIGRTL